jgi:hypothetical protein
MLKDYFNIVLLQRTIHILTRKGVEIQKRTKGPTLLCLLQKYS